MEPHISWFTVLLNKWLGGPALALLNALHIKPNNPATPIPEHVAMELIAFILVAIGALYLKSRLSVERPGGFQQVCEMLLTNPLKFGIRDLLDENIPHHGGRKFIPLVGSVSVFVLVCGLLGAVSYTHLTLPTIYSV